MATFMTRTSGDWENPSFNTIWMKDGGVADRCPVPGDTVFIGATHRITRSSALNWSSGTIQKTGMDVGNGGLIFTAPCTLSGTGVIKFDASTGSYDPTAVLTFTDFAICGAPGGGPTLTAATNLTMGSFTSVGTWTINFTGNFTFPSALVPNVAGTGLIASKSNCTVNMHGQMTGFNLADQSPIAIYRFDGDTYFNGTLGVGIPGGQSTITIADNVALTMGPNAFSYGYTAWVNGRTLTFGTNSVLNTYGPAGNNMSGVMTSATGVWNAYGTATFMGTVNMRVNCFGPVTLPPMGLITGANTRIKLFRREQVVTNGVGNVIFDCSEAYGFGREQ